MDSAEKKRLLELKKKKSSIIAVINRKTILKFDFYKKN